MLTYDDILRFIIVFRSHISRDSDRFNIILSRFTIVFFDHIFYDTKSLFHNRVFVKCNFFSNSNILGYEFANFFLKICSQVDVSFLRWSSTKSSSIIILFSTLKNLNLIIVKTTNIKNHYPSTKEKVRKKKTLIIKYYYY